MLLYFCLKIGEVDIALGIAAHHHNGQTHHLGGCGVRAMRRRRNEADTAMTLALRLLITPNGHDARVLALRARVRLKAHFRKACNFNQPVAQFSKHGLVTLRLLLGNKGMKACKLGPADRGHLGRRIELHGA